MEVNEKQDQLDDQKNVADNYQISHDKGRPTKQEQIDIERKLRPYFEMGHSATQTARRTGLNIKTVLRYFELWYQEIEKSEQSDFLNRCKKEKERALISLSNEICSLNDDKKEIELLIEASRKAGNFGYVEKFYKLKLKTVETIGKFSSARINLTNAPTLDILMEISKLEEKKDGN